MGVRELREDSCPPRLFERYGSRYAHETTVKNLTRTSQVPDGSGVIFFSSPIFYCRLGIPFFLSHVRFSARGGVEICVSHVRHTHVLQSASTYHMCVLSSVTSLYVFFHFTWGSKMEKLFLHSSFSILQSKIYLSHLNWFKDRSLTCCSR